MDLNFDFKEIISTFMVLFAVIDITGSIPVVIGLKESGKKVNGLSAALISFVIFVLFLFVGDVILSLFGVDISSFAVAGALVLFILAIEMLLGIELFKNDGESKSATIVPIIFPLIAGAGALTTLLSLRAEYAVENIIVASALNMLIVYFVLTKLKYVQKILGKGGVYVLRKFFGIILLAMAVKLFSSNIVSLFP